MPILVQSGEGIEISLTGSSRKRRSVSHWFGADRAERSVEVTEDITIPIEYVSQQKYKYLCWAACLIMIGKYIGARSVTDVDPLTIVSVAQKCTGLPASQCDQSQVPEDVLNKFGIKYDGAYSGRPLSQDELDNLIRQRKPVQIAYKGDGTVGHVFLVIGLVGNSDASERRYKVLDPIDNYDAGDHPGGVPYVIGKFAFLNYNDRGRWAKTFAGLEYDDSALVS